MTHFTINEEKKKDEPFYYEVYTFFGKHDYLDENKNPLLDYEIDEKNKDEVFSLKDAYALKFTKGNRSNYYVKRNRHGRLYDPVGMYSEGRADIFMNEAGRPQWKFEPVSKKVFDLYVNYLKTKNPAWINNANREV